MTIPRSARPDRALQALAFAPSPGFLKPCEVPFVLVRYNELQVSSIGIWAVIPRDQRQEVPSPIAKSGQYVIHILRASDFSKAIPARRRLLKSPENVSS